MDYQDRTKPIAGSSPEHSPTRPDAQLSPERAPLVRDLGPAGPTAAGQGMVPTTVRDLTWEVLRRHDMTTVSLLVRRAVPSDAVAVTGTISRAVCLLPVAEWLVPDPQDRHRIVTAYVGVMVEHALRASVVYVIDGRAAAVWTPHTPLGRTQQLPGNDARLRGIGGAAQAKFADLHRVLATGHPQPTHHHLQVLAVEPGQENTGVGGELLDAHHRILDRLARPAYVTATEKTIRFFTGHGYEPHSDGPLLIPGGPQITPLWRRPQPARLAPYTRRPHREGPRRAD